MKPFRVVMMGATGAVGSQAVAALLAMPEVAGLTLLGRRPLAGCEDPKVVQHTVDVVDPATYAALLPDHHAAVCTLGIGQPSGVDRAAFERLDREAVRAFGQACREAQVRHFELLGSVGADPQSRSFYLRVKGLLEQDLEGLGFPRLSLFQPSMLLTPENRYDWKQGLMLRVWPVLDPLFQGRGRRFRGVRVATLGRAMARNLGTSGAGVERLHWDDFQRLAGEGG